MEALTIRDVKLLQQSNIKITQLQLIHTIYKSRSCYEVIFTVNANNTNKVSTLITTRNQPYRLVDLNRGISFIYNLFPSLSKVELCINKNSSNQTNL